MTETDYDVYSPDPEDPSDLGQAQRKLWDRSFLAAQEIYGAVEESAKACGQSAWRCVADLYDDEGYGRKHNFSLTGQRDIAPVPDAFVSLGRLREIVAIVNGEHKVIAFDDNYKLPHILWCQRTREVWVFVDLKETSRDNGPHPEEAVYKRWHRRKMREVIRGPMRKEFDMYCLGMGDSVSYRSDKWGEASDDDNLTGSQEYYHMHTGNGVRVWVDNLSNPRVFRIKGGFLDVHDKGLIH